MNKLTKFILLFVILFVCWLIGRSIDVDTEYYRQLLLSYPLAVSCVIFIVLYVGITFFVWFVAKDVFRITSAVIFGPVVSTLLVFVAESLNALVLFFLSRKLGQEYVEQKFKLKSDDIAKVKKDSSPIGLFALRINPLIPFRLMDLSVGLTRVSLKKYLGVVIVASLPRIFWLQYILAGVGDAIFKDVGIIYSYLIENPFIVLYSGIYFLMVVILTIVAVALRMKRQKNV